MMHSKKKVKIIAAISATVVAFQISFMPVSAEPQFFVYSPGAQLVYSPEELLQQYLLHQADKQCQYRQNLQQYKYFLTQKEAYSSDYADIFLWTEQRKFPNGKYWNSKDPDTWTDEPCNHAEVLYRIGCTSFEVKTFNSGYTGRDFKNTGYFQIPYYQCAGFASKLAYDYFDGCNYWVRQNYSSGFQFRVGDQIRLKIGKEEHSVFVTSVNSPYSLTIAHCNADEQCGICWNDSIIVRSWEDKQELELRSARCSVAYITRPAMYGDVNGDSRITYEDVTAINQIVLRKYNYGNSDPDAVKQAADLDHNGVLNSNDWELAKSQYNSDGYFESQGFLTSIGRWKDLERA